MRSEWKKVQLGDVASVRGGKRLPKGKRLVTSNSAHPYIRVRDMSGTKVLEINEKFEFVPTDAVEEINRYKVNTNDIIISIVGSVGEVSMVGASLDGANLTENCAKISKLNDEKINAEYLYYYLTSSLGQNNISKGTVGAVQLKLPLKNIRSLEILLPVLPTQKAIASVLSCLDAKIELNNKINENLEAQAQAVFKSWFVDFEPFQDGEFIESELGLIPEGWRIGKVDDILELHDSRRVPLSSREREGMDKNYPYYGAASLMDYVKDYIFDGVYLLLGEDGTVINEDGHPILQYVYGRFWVNNHAHVISARSAYTVEHLYVLFSHLNVHSAVTGAVQKKINQRNLKSIPIILPPQGVVAKYNAVIEPLFSQRRKLEKQNKALSSLRDTLLPKLMSGEIEVPVD